jgi:hypothetical protein
MFSTWVAIRSTFFGERRFHGLGPVDTGHQMRLRKTFWIGEAGI